MMPMITFLMTNNFRLGALFINVNNTAAANQQLKEITSENNNDNSASEDFV